MSDREKVEHEIIDSHQKHNQKSHGSRKSSGGGGGKGGAVKKTKEIRDLGRKRAKTATKNKLKGAKTDKKIAKNDPKKAAEIKKTQQKQAKLRSVNKAKNRLRDEKAAAKRKTKK